MAVTPQTEPIVDDGDVVYSTLHCSAAYHISQFTGKGASQAFYLYDVCRALGHESDKAFPNLRHLASFFHCHENQLYAAAKMLVSEGWLMVKTQKQGVPSTYSAIDHDAWASTHTDRCVQKLSPDYWKGDPLGAAFYGATGGCKIPGPNILVGWLRLCDGDADRLLAHAKAYVADHPLPRHVYQYPTWRNDFGSYLREQS
jgi:hypothetical protein